MKRFWWAVLLTMLWIPSSIVSAGHVVVHSVLSAHNTLIEQAYSALGHAVTALHEEITTDAVSDVALLWLMEPSMPYSTTELEAIRSVLDSGGNVSD